MSADLYDDLKGQVADLRREEPLSSHTTIQVGGPARIAAFPAGERELAAILAAARRRRDAGETVEMRLIGGGANCFGDSRGFDGLVVSTTGWKEPFSLDGDLLVLGAGADLEEAALRAAGAGWGGIDFMAEVPGTLGGAVAINAGTNVGGCVADRFEWAETLTWQGERRRRGRDEMEFGYRTSRLLYGREIVVRAAFRLVSCDALRTTPEGLRARFDAVMAERKGKFPYEFPNFGSTFRSPGAPHAPAGKLLDDLGLKGFRVGGAQVSEKHANFVVNRGGATSEDILAVMGRMHDAVLERHGVALKPEVHYLCNEGRPRPEFFEAFD